MWLKCEVFPSMLIYSLNSFSFLRSVSTPFRLWSSIITYHPFFGIFFKVVYLVSNYNTKLRL